MKQKILFLYIQAWGGHISTAKALATYMQKHHPEIDPVLVDGFAQAPRRLKRIVIDGYKTSQTYAQWAFSFLYRCNKRRVIAKISQIILSRLVSPYIQKVIQQEQPSHMVILHFFLVRPTVKMIQKSKQKILATTIITDPFTLHPLRNLDRTMEYVVFSEQAKHTLIQRKVPSNQVTIFPVILKEEFSTPLSASQILAKKQELGFDPSKKIIFIMWAGDGMPRGAQIVQGLIDIHVDAQIMIVCGRNQKLYQKIHKIAAKHPEYTIKIFGFVDFMYDLVNIADIVITKGGPATLMEILLMQKIPVISTYIWEQEKGNMEFVVHNHAGIYEPNTKKLVQRVKVMVHHDMSYYHQNIRQLHLKNGTAQVAEYLIHKKKKD